VIIGSLWVDIHVLGARSLKDKRRIVKGLKERIRAHFNVSVAEVGSLDLWQRAEIGIACVSNDKSRVDGQLAAILDKIRLDPSVGIIDSAMEIF
jgi:uncharacterized protein